MQYCTLSVQDRINARKVQRRHSVWPWHKAANKSKTRIYLFNDGENVIEGEPATCAAETGDSALDWMADGAMNMAARGGAGRTDFLSVWHACPFCDDHVLMNRVAFEAVDMYAIDSLCIEIMIRVFAAGAVGYAAQR